MTDVSGTASIFDGAKLDYRITQISLVVRDLRKTMEQYHTILGWGPWNVFEHVPPMHHDTRVEGEPVHYTLLGAETYVGGEETGMNFELLQPLEGPSLWQKYPRREGRGHLLDRSDVQDYRGVRGGKATLRSSRNAGEYGRTDRGPHRVLLR